MVLRLAGTLDIGLRESNELLHAAGLPGAYPQATLDARIWRRTGQPSTGCST
jgi:hypothetical protein